MLSEYLYIYYVLIILILIGLLIYLISYIFSERIIDLEKLSVYECGFDPFEDTRQVFEIKYYLVAILFIIFDLEILFVFPWIFVILHIGYIGFFCMYIFLFLLVLIYIYETFLGILDW